MKAAERVLSSNEVRAILWNQGFLVSDQNWDRLEQWVSLLETFNRQVNLVSRSDIPRIWGRHLLPSLLLLVFRDIPEESRICDFGSGGGFPGMPLAICRPDLQVTMLEARQKKTRIIDQMIEKLSLRNAFTLQGRGEELGRSMIGSERFPVLSARAVASLDRLDRWTRNLREDKSKLHVFKGGNLDEEIRKLQKGCPGIEWEQTPLDIPEFPYLAENRKCLVTLNFHSG